MPCKVHLSFQLPSLVCAFLLAGCASTLCAFAQTAAADCASYGSVPLPSEAAQIPVPKTFPVCASYRSYKGIGRTVNYTEARRCAWQERLAQRADLGQNEQEPLAWYVGGSLILADIYFNGTGVQRNSPLAMRFACEAEEGMATLALPDIRKRQVLRRPSKPFEFCEYAVTTFSMNFCAAYDDAIDDDRRDRYYKSLKTSMAPNQRAAFDRLLADELAYVQAHTGEVYQGGTIRGLRTIGSQDILKNLFHTQIVHFERRKWPKISETRIAAADDLLGREYKKAQQRALAQTSEMIDDGAVTADQLSAAQKSWSAYRDAWIAFAGLRYPDAVRLIRAEITLDRCRLLKTI